MRSCACFNQIGVEYDRHERFAGDSKYSFRKLWMLAKNGIYNFSDFPVSLMRRIGFSAILMSIVYFVFILCKKLFYNTVPPGFTSLVFLIMLFAGLQFIFLGVLGEYVLRIFFQSKQRPLFIIREYITAVNSFKEEEFGKEKQKKSFIGS